MVALGVGLRAAGCAVQLAGPRPLAHLARSYDLAYEPVAGDPDHLSRALADRAGLSWPRMIQQMAAHARPVAESVFRAAERATAGADLIVHSLLMTDTGHTLARLRGVPDVSALFFPMFLPTRAFPAVAFPDLPLGGGYRLITHRISTAVFRYGSRLLYRRVRASAPFLPKLAPWPFAGREASRTTVLLAYSRQVLPRPDDWPANAHLTGYWQLPPPPRWTPQPELLSFLEAGPAPVYFSPGSVRTELLRRLCLAVGAAANKHDLRLVLGIAPEEMPAPLENASTIVAPAVPHSWLFPRMRFILHHGGAGTTGAAVAAGIPNTALPFSADQGFWAARIHRLGLGPAGVPAKQLTVSRAGAILKDAVETAAYRRRAEAIGDAMGQEEGVAAAVALIRGSMDTTSGHERHTGGRSPRI